MPLVPISSAKFNFSLLPRAIGLPVLLDFHVSTWPQAPSMVAACAGHSVLELLVWAPFRCVSASRRESASGRDIGPGCALRCFDRFDCGAVAFFCAFWPWNSKALPRECALLRHVACCTALPTHSGWVLWLAAKTTATGASFFHRWSVAMLETRVTATASVIIALLALLVWDQRHAMRERAVLAGEMASAREIQRNISSQNSCRQRRDWPLRAFIIRRA